MPDLYPTKTRLRLLDEVDRHGVLIRGDDSYDPYGLRVTARMAELETSGWVERDGATWWPTARGRQLLGERDA